MLWIVLLVMVRLEVIMATIKVFDSEGVKELGCFDTLLDVPYLVDEEQIVDEPKDSNPFE